MSDENSRIERLESQIWAEHHLRDHCKALDMFPGPDFGCVLHEEREEDQCS